MKIVSLKIKYIVFMSIFTISFIPFSRISFAEMINTSDIYDDGTYKYDNSALESNISSEDIMNSINGITNKGTSFTESIDPSAIYDYGTYKYDNFALESNISSEDIMNSVNGITKKKASSKPKIENNLNEAVQGQTRINDFTIEQQKFNLFGWFKDLL